MSGTGAEIRTGHQVTAGDECQRHTTRAHLHHIEGWGPHPQGSSERDRTSEFDKAGARGKEAVDTL